MIRKQVSVKMRLLSFVLTVVMALGILPLNAFSIGAQKKNVVKIETAQLTDAGVGYGRALVGTTNTIASVSNDALHYLGTYFYTSYYPGKGFKVEFTKTAGYLRDGTIFNLNFP